MLRFSVPLALSLTLLLAACDSGPDPGPPPASTITGIWVDEIVTNDLTYMVELDLTEMNGEVGGIAEIRSVQDTLSGTVRGTYVHPHVMLNMTFDRPPLGTVSGNVNEARDEIDGTIAWPGYFFDTLLTLQRVQAPIAAP